VDALAAVVGLVVAAEHDLVEEWVAAERDPVVAWVAGILVEVCLHVQPVVWEVPPR
jgi:3-phosphoglycerate kinase